jgi:hypothetical protein
VLVSVALLPGKQPFAHAFNPDQLVALYAVTAVICQVHCCCCCLTRCYQRPFRLCPAHLHSAGAVCGKDELLTVKQPPADVQHSIKIWLSVFVFKTQL